jgi:hypothetical protein
LKFGLVVAIFPNLIANDYKSHVVVNGLVTFWVIFTSAPNFLSRANWSGGGNSSFNNEIPPPQYKHSSQVGHRQKKAKVGHHKMFPHA